MTFTLFNATTDANGTEPWVTDGTAAGTMLLRDLYPDLLGAPPGSFPSGYTRLDGSAGPKRALFTATSILQASLDLWSTDGTAAGTVRLAVVGSIGDSYAATSLGNGKVVFEVTKPGQRSELWVSDGTTGGTAMLRVVNPGVFPNGAGPLVAVGAGRAVFSEPSDVVNRQLWTTDGTAAGTVPVLGAVGNLSDLVPVGDGRALFFSNQGGPPRLWTTDGTAAGTAVVSNVPGSYGSLAATGGGRFIFSVQGQLSSPGYTYTLWTTDGTAAGTVPFYTPPQALTNPPSGFTAVGGGRVAFATTTTSQGQPLKQVWVTDGTVGGTVLLANLPGQGDTPNSFTALDVSRFVFQATDDVRGQELWVSDGTAAGTGLLRDIYPGATSSGIKGLTAIGDGRALFQATNGATGAELWITDGTADGTALLRDISPGQANGNPTSFLPLTAFTLDPSTVVVRGTVTDRPGNQAYVGATGRNFVNFNEGRRGAVLTAAGDTATITHAGQSDTLRGIAELRFVDGRVVFDLSDPAAQVARLYQAALGRAPDQGGLNFWISSIGGSASLADLATGFLSSPEFTARFGAGLDNQAFVTRIYQNVLGRDPEAGGLAFWTGNLDRGAQSRGSVLAAISESAENKAGTAALVQAGIWDRSEAAQQVARLYDTALGRLPDAGGLAFWTSSIEGGTGTLMALAQTFVASAEFVATYGSLGNRQFVERVYGNTLGRAGDAGGVDYWTGQLDNGLSRAAVTIGFSESAEHQARTAASTGGETADTYGVRLA